MKGLFQPIVEEQSIANQYTQKIQIPQYEPKRKAPFIAEMYDSTKYAELCRDIKKSSVSDEEKAFLLLAASRHISFNYSKVADYYANASAEMQRLMEDSALVVIDIDDAIAKGYVQLSDHINKIMEAYDEG